MGTLAWLVAAAALVFAAPAPRAPAEDPVVEAAARYAALDGVDVDSLAAKLEVRMAGPAQVGPFAMPDRAELLAVCAAGDREASGRVIVPIRRASNAGVRTRFVRRAVARNERP